MGKRGPSPRPTHLRVLDGNPSKRPLNGDEPRPEGSPTCPTTLDKEAQAEWRRIEKSMPPSLYAAVDRGLLTAWCSAWSLHRKAAKALAEEGEVIDTARGPARNPWLGIQNDQTKIMISIASRLGFSPADRTNLKMQDQSGPQSKFSGLIGTAK